MRHPLVVLVATLVVWCVVAMGHSPLENELLGHMDTIVDAIEPGEWNVPDGASGTDDASPLTPRQAWIASGNAAYHMNTHEVDAITVPAHVNVIFVGFDGDGHDGIEVLDHQMAPWFRHVAHWIRHSVVPVGEEQTTILKSATRSTGLGYDVRMNVVKLDPLVNTIIEDALVYGVRPDTEKASAGKPAYGGGTYYVDAYRVSTILHNLLQYLKLTKSYTLFIMNPKKPISKFWHTYGFRAGFAQHEIDALFANPQPYLDALKEREAKERAQRAEDASGGQKGTKKPKYPPLPPIPEAQVRGGSNVDGEKAKKGQSYHALNLQEHSSIWARWYIQQYGNASSFDCSGALDEEDRDIRCVTLSQPQEQTIHEIAMNIATHGAAYEREYLTRVLTEETYAECLSDVWISHERFAWVDVSAGPFRWGPSVAGDGVRTYFTLPYIRWASHRVRQLNEHEAEHNYHALKPKEDAFLAKMEQFDNDCGSDDVFTDEALMAYCQDFERRLQSEELEIADERQKIDANAEETDNFGSDMTLDYWLSDIGAVITSSLRHVFIPPVPLFATPYATRVVFHTYIVSDHTAYNARDAGHFMYGAWRREVERLRLPTQEFSFTLHTLSMSSDHTLAMAFRGSIRSAVLPNLSPTGEFEPTDQLYVDSKELRAALHTIHTGELDKHDVRGSDGGGGMHTIHAVQRHIPIFIFSLNERYPVFVDKYYTAKALSDMIIAVQSPHAQWPSRLQCGRYVVHWNLRNPLRSVLAATALSLGGVVPPHITYDEAHEAASQQWLWSVGDHPMSHTTHGHRFARLHADVVARNYVMHALEVSRKVVNNGVARLRHHRTTAANWAAVEVMPVDETIQAYERVRQRWIQLAKLVEALDWNNAVKQLDALNTETLRFSGYTTEIGEMMELFKCVDVPDVDEAPTSSLHHWIVPICLILNVSLAAMYLWMRNTSRKMKVN